MNPPFPQRKRHRRTNPPTEAETMLRSAIATAQHAAKRGYEIRPEDRRKYHNAFRVLRKHGLSCDEAWAMLRADFAVG